MKCWMYAFSHLYVVQLNSSQVNDDDLGRHVIVRERPATYLSDVCFCKVCYCSIGCILY